MKKLYFFLAIAFSNYVSGQITLENTFPINEIIFTYSTSSEFYYISETNNNVLKIYNSDFTIYKTVNIPVSTDYQCTIWYDSDYHPLISKHIFNTDDNFEFLVKAYNSSNSITKLLLIDEDGNLIYDFHENGNYSFGNYYKIFHDSVENNNKFIVRSSNISDYSITYDVYSLPTTSLNLDEVQATNKLSVFPVPTEKTLHLINPKNGSSSLEVYDINGRKVMNEKLINSENQISIDVENLSKGTYILKIGNLNSKFVKN